MTDGDEAREYIEELKRSRGLKTLETVGQGVMHIARCVDENKRATRELSGDVGKLTSDVRGLTDRLEWLIKEIDRDHEKRVWDGIMERRQQQPAAPNGNGLSSAGQFIRLGLIVIGLGFLALILWTVVLSPQAGDLLRSIIGKSP